jgi:hypothetical protein
VAKKKSEPAANPVEEINSESVAVAAPRKWIVQVQTLRPEVIEAESEQEAREEYRQRLNFITTRQPWSVREITGETGETDPQPTPSEPAPADGTAEDDANQPLVI